VHAAEFLLTAGTFASRLRTWTFQTPALAAFDIEVDINSCFPELLLAVETIDVACRYCTLAIRVDKGVYKCLGLFKSKCAAHPTIVAMMLFKTSSLAV